MAHIVELRYLADRTEREVAEALAMARSIRTTNAFGLRFGRNMEYL